MSKIPVVKYTGSMLRHVGMPHTQQSDIRRKYTVLTQSSSSRTLNILLFLHVLTLPNNEMATTIRADFRSDADLYDKWVSNLSVYLLIYMNGIY